MTSEHPHQRGAYSRQRAVPDSSQAPLSWPRLVSRMVIGSAIGQVLGYLLSGFVLVATGNSTGAVGLLINLIGGILGGLAAGLLAPRRGRPLAAMVGVCAGVTLVIGGALTLMSTMASPAINPPAIGWTLLGLLLTVVGAAAAAAAVWVLRSRRG